MSLNKILLTPKRRLVNTIKTQSRYIRELKTPQPIGGDILTVQSLPGPNLVDVIGPYYVGPYDGGADNPPATYIPYVWVPDNQTLTLWNFLWSLYVDPPSFNDGGIPDSSSQWPFGEQTSLYENDLIRVTPGLDWAQSSDELNTRFFYLYVYNADSVGHTLYAAFKSYFPDLNQSK